MLVSSLAAAHVPTMVKRGQRLDHALAAPRLAAEAPGWMRLRHRSRAGCSRRGSG